MDFGNLTEEQRADALRKSAEARRERVELKARIASGELSVADAMEEPAARRMTVSQLLRAVNGVGPARAEEIASEAGVALRRRIAGTGCLQRARLVEALERRRLGQGGGR